ncbi:aminotransferase class V-fold PLP-dependent enzyme [Nocardioides pocheonensis]|uniref:aminotransferase class V-fold PLP-dependent enzyme n=1 Tax=Nocardioides pocheonensis TaxID=661485 RepID=UPI001C838118|nr:aminotransferase class V-fold PLP-dependent enzyme [Nocardioides pocheonensis]
MSPVIDLSAARAETPGCLDRVFLDSAGSSLPTTRVLETVVGHLRREAEVGGYRAAAEREAELAAVPESVGRLLGCDPDLVALTDSATRAWDLFVTALPWSAGDRVLVCGTEYASNAIALLQRARLDGCVVEIVPNDDRGLVDLAALEAVLDERVRLVSLVHVPTNSGQVAPVREVVELAHRAGALVLLDACQSVGQLAVDVEELGVDALSATGRKWLRAPRGTGFLHVRREVLEALEPASADLRGASWTGSHDYELAPGARRFELWEYDVAARLGLKVAVDQLLDLGVADVEAAVRSRADDLRRGLDDLERVTVRDVGPDLSGIVSFTVDGLRAEEVRDRLADQRVTVTVSGAASTRLDMAERGLEAVVRASPHYFVSPGDVQRAVEAVAGLA